LKKINTIVARLQGLDPGKEAPADAKAGELQLAGGETDVAAVDSPSIDGRPSGRPMDRG
jgi:hypothetical protein